MRSAWILVGSRAQPRAKMISAATACCLLAACGGAPLHRTDVAQKLPDQVAPIAVGQSDRAAVRTLLGEPQLASNYWRFELFRFSGSKTRLGLLYIVPYSVTTNTDASALVTYDSNGTVVALDEGVNRATPGWGGHEPSLMLKAGDTIVVSQVGRTTSLYVSAGQRDAYLGEVRPRDRCTVVLGCDAERQCPSTLTVDNKAQPPLATPPASASSQPGAHQPPPYPVRAWLTPSMLAPGDHHLETRTEQKVVAETTIHCSAGELLYALIDSPIQVSSAMPAAFGQQPMLTYSDGWLVPQEPGHE